MQLLLLCYYFFILYVGAHSNHAHNSDLGMVVANNQVMMDDVERWIDRGGRAWLYIASRFSDVGKERLAIPRIERPMVTRLAAGVEDNVVGDLIATSEPCEKVKKNQRKSAWTR